MMKRQLSTQGGARRQVWRLGPIVILALLFSSTMPAVASPYGSTHGSVSNTGEKNVFLPMLRNQFLAGASSTYDVTYTANTVVIDAVTMTNHLISVDDASTYRFRPGATVLGDLAPGRVVLFAGRELRKVATVKEEGGALVVTTGHANLNEAIATGTIAWTRPVSWMDLPLQSYMSMFASDNSTMRVTSVSGFTPDGLPIKNNAQVPVTVSWQGKVDDWDVKLNLTITPTRLDVSVTGSKQVGQAAIYVSGKGWIGAFTHELFLSYEESTPTRMTTRTLDIQGEMELEWGAATPSQDKLEKDLMFRIPAELPIPFAVGPIPVVLKMKVVLQVVPVLAVPQASSRGNFKAVWSSDQGMTVENNLINPTGELKSSSFTVGDTMSLGIGPVGLGVGVEFPRLEISVLGVTPAAISLKTYSYSIYSHFPPCQKGGTDLLALAIFQLGFFGWTFAQSQQVLWKESFVKYADDRPC